MEIKKTNIDDVLIIKPSVFEDDRGFFFEVYRKDIFNDLGLNVEFVQDNHSRSVYGTIRGLHFQWDPLMGKLMRVTRGKAFLVAVDMRRKSKTIGEWFGIEISENDKTQIWAPAGFARGFCALSDIVEIQYKCTGIYNSNCESGILWNDPKVGINWPLDNPILSEKDKVAQTLDEWLEKKESNNFLI